MEQALREDARVVAELIRTINEAWLEGRTEELHRFFHDDMIIAGPNAAKMGEGREACVKSYTDFIDSAHIAHFDSKEVSVDVWGNAALAFYEFEITYKMHGMEYHETGRDVFLFTRESATHPWLAVWRMVIPVEAHTEQAEEPQQV